MYAHLASSALMQLCMYTYVQQSIHFFVQYFLFYIASCSPDHRLPDSSLNYDPRDTVREGSFSSRHDLSRLTGKLAHQQTSTTKPGEESRVKTWYSHYKDALVSSAHCRQRAGLPCRFEVDSLQTFEIRPL